MRFLKMLWKVFIFLFLCGVVFHIDATFEPIYNCDKTIPRNQSAKNNFVYIFCKKLRIQYKQLIKKYTMIGMQIAF